MNSQLGDYVMFPIRHVLSKDALGDRISELVLDVIAFLYRTAYHTATVADTAQQFIAVAIYLMSGPPEISEKDGAVESKTRRFMETSNELKASACRAISEIILAAKASKTALTNLPSTAHLVSLALDCVESAASMTELQLDALRMLDAVLFEVVDSNDKLAMFLPGVTSSLVKLATGKFGKAHFKAVVTTLNILGKTISSCFSDADLKRQESSDLSTELKKSDVQKIRTDAWINGTKHQVKISLETLTNLRYHSRPEVQKAFLGLYRRLVANSQESLDNCTQLFVDNVVFFASNEDLRDSVQDIVNQWSLDTAKFENVFEPRVYDWIDSLPRVLTVQDSQRAVSFIEAIRFSSSYLSGSADEMQVLEKLARVLMASLQVEPLKAIPTVNFTEIVESVTGDLTLPPRTVDHTLPADVGVVTDLPVPTQKALAKLLEDIGASKMGVPLLRLLANWMQARTETDIPLYWVLTNVLHGAAQARSSSLLSMEDETGSQGANVVLDILEMSTDFVSQKHDTMVAQTCLSLDTISYVAQYLGQEFRHALVETLFPVVEMLGSNNGLVANRAKLAAIQIGRSCGYPSVRAVLVDNADYIVDGVSSRLASLDLTPSTPLILTTLVQLTGSSVAPYLDDLVATMFSVLDNYHGYTLLVQGIFQFFFTVVGEVSKTLRGTQLLEDRRTMRQHKAHISTLEGMLAELDRKPNVNVEGAELISEREVSEFHNLPDDAKARAFDTGRSQEGGDEGEDPAEVPTKKKWDSPVPEPTYRLIHKITEYSSTFLTHEAAPLRHRLLELIQLSVPILATSKDDFLPVVNTYWPLVSSRLEDTEPFIVDKALACIAQTCKYSGDFMTSRIVRVWPVIKRLTPRVKDAVRTHSGAERLLMSLDSSLSVIFGFTPVPAALFDDAVALYADFMKYDRAKSLQVAFEEINPDAVWLAVHDNHQTITPPSSPHYQFVSFP